MPLSFGRSNTISFFSSFKTECTRFTLSTLFSNRYVKLIMLLNHFRHVSPLTLILIAVFLEGSSSTMHDSVNLTSFSVILTCSALSRVCSRFSVLLSVSKLSSKVKNGDFRYSTDKEFQSHTGNFLKTAKKCLYGYVNIFLSLDKSNRVFCHHHQNQGCIFAVHHFCNSK